MLDGALYPRLRAAVRLDDRPAAPALTLGDTDVEFKGVPRALLADVIGRFSGRETLDAICARYPERATGVVRLIAAELLKRRMLLLSQSGRDGWPADPAGPTWHYILDRVPNPVDAFARWCTEPVIVTGSGRSFAMAVTGLLDAGIGHLAIGPDDDASRQTVADRLTARANRDSGFVWRWLAPTDPIDPQAMIVRAVDEDPLVGDGWPARTRRHTGRSVIAGTTRQGGMVTRTPEDWQARAAAPGEAVPMSPYAFAVLGSMAAFQTLNATIADDAQTEGLLPLAGTTLIRPDGSFIGADAPAPAALDRSDAGDARRSGAATSRSPHRRERERWIAWAQPFFMAPTPLLAWADEASLSVFPLAHRALDVLPDEGGHRLAVWAASPSEVTARTIRRGLETVADRIEGATGHAVAADMAEWSTRAYLAWAEAHAPSELLQPATWTLGYDDVDDVDFRTLARLVALYLGDAPSVGISLDGRSGAVRADVEAGGCRRFALGTSALSAAVEALGRALSAWQLGEPKQRARSVQPVAIVPCQLGLTEEVVFHPDRVALVAHRLDRLGDLPLRDFVVGRYRRIDGDG